MDREESVRRAEELLTALSGLEAERERYQALARRQEAVAELGQRALAEKDLPRLMDEAVHRVATMLEVEYVKVLELLPNGSALLLRAGVGWNEGYVGSATASVNTESQAGYTLRTGAPVSVEDLATETRFPGPALLREHGVVSGISVIIQGSTLAYGVLGAHTTGKRRFTAEEIQFLQSIANMLGLAIERRRAEATWQRLLGEVETAQERERKRIARELHDQMGQLVAALTFAVRSLQESVPGTSPARARLEELQQLAGIMGAEVRYLLHELRPVDLDGMDLPAALSRHLAQWTERFRIPVEVQHTGLGAERLPAHIETALYRIAQEALTNVARHAQARRVDLILERRDHLALLVVEDDGRGFDVAGVASAPAPERRLGLLGMEERAVQLGGTVTIESAPGRGTTVLVRIPIGEAVT
jgi:signal transduction histidine kinase